MGHLRLVGALVYTKRGDARGRTLYQKKTQTENYEISRHTWPPRALTNVSSVSPISDRMDDANEEVELELALKELRASRSQE